MSTICKLNPKVRDDRRMRAKMVRTVRIVRDQSAEKFGIGTPQEFVAHEVSKLTESVYRSSNRTGAGKNLIFQRLARELNGAAPGN